MAVVWRGNIVAATVAIDFTLSDITALIRVNEFDANLLAAEQADLPPMCCAEVVYFLVHLFFTHIWRL